MGCDGWLAAGCWLGRVQCGRSPSWRWIELGLVAQVPSCKNGLGNIAVERTNPGRPNRTNNSYSVRIEKEQQWARQALRISYRRLVPYRKER